MTQSIPNILLFFGLGIMKMRLDILHSSDIKITSVLSFTSSVIHHYIKLMSDSTHT